MTDTANGTLTADQTERRLLTKRRFARVAFWFLIAMSVIVTALGLGVDGYAERIGAMAGFLGTIVIGFFGIVATYMGASAWMSVAKK